MITIMKYSNHIGSLVVFFLVSFSAFGQINTTGNWGKGLNFSPQDSSFQLKFGFRFQTLYQGVMDLETNDYEDRLLTRRSRLKFDGWAFNPNVVYKVELAISNRDHRSGHIPESGNTANIVLDAAVKWKFAPGWQLWFGQTKLPGNRERVISSQKLQFVDRSLVNSRYTLDRDLGVQLRHKSKMGNAVVNQAIALSMGEGRNIISANPGGGHQITGRIEFLPMGDFTSKGDYFSSDLKREGTPKLSLGITGDFNDNAVRQRGNLGGFNTDASGEYITTDLTTLMVDAHFKYNGFSALSEYAYKSSTEDLGNFGVGQGFVIQGGYLTDKNVEIAGRYTTIMAETNSTISDITEYTLGLSKYVIGHSLKVQTDISLQDNPNNSNDLVYRLQVEVAL